MTSRRLLRIPVATAFVVAVALAPPAALAAPGSTDIAVSADLQPSTAAAGDITTLTVQVDNLTRIDTPQVGVTLDLPPGLRPADGTDGAGGDPAGDQPAPAAEPTDPAAVPLGDPTPDPSVALTDTSVVDADCTGTGSQLQCVLGALAPRDGAAFSLDLVLDGVAGTTTYPVSVTAVSGLSDRNPANDTATTAVQLTAAVTPSPTPRPTPSRTPSPSPTSAGGAPPPQGPASTPRATSSQRPTPHHSASPHRSRSASQPAVAGPQGPTTAVPAGLASGDAPVPWGWLVLAVFLLAIVSLGLYLSRPEDVEEATFHM